MWLARAHIALGELAAAEATVERLAASAGQGKAFARDDALGVARGALRLARGDAEGAIAAVEGLSDEFDFALLGRVTLAEALERLGKADEAAPVRAAIARWYKRDLSHAFLRATLGAGAG
jgi:tellurite resistance protein